MRWCCFLFWVGYRFTLAALAHFNWFTSIYMNCIYLVLWKSYDMLWFWMHLVLCICLKPLRTRNYLIVWFNLIHKRITRYPNSSYKKIYLLEYGKLKKSKVQKLNETSEAEGSDEEVEEESDADNKFTGAMEVERTKLEELNPRKLKISSAKSLTATMRVEEERECMKRIFWSGTVSSNSAILPHYNPNADRGMPTPPPRLKKQAAKSRKQHDPENGSLLFISRCWNLFHIPDIILTFLKSCKQCTYCREEKLNIVLKMESDGKNNASGVGSQVGLTAQVRRYLPLTKSGLGSSNVEDDIDILIPDFTNKRDLTSVKEIALREKRDKRSLKKRLQARRRAELPAVAKYEAKQKTISNAVELLLQILQMMASFAILIGNVRRIFYLVHFNWLKPDKHGYDNIGLVMLWSCAVFLDVLLFWISIIWTYCLQWHLCCRLGLLKFWMWVLMLAVIGGVFMLYPMLYVQDNLDVNWCQFKANSTLAQYQPKW
uniref:Uncharacterized protein n=1 Tax=Setaria digitata TaxID=48799 RepID=A0A915PKC5_9BILA